MTTALAAGRKLAPQEIRTFFVSSSTFQRIHIFQTERMSKLFLDVLMENRAKARFQLHEFVLMRDHFHLLLTPAQEVSLEKAVQYIKGGFSFRAKRELGYKGEIWQAGYNEHRIKDANDYEGHVRYIHANPVKERLCEKPEDYEYSSANGRFELDAAPDWVKTRI
jgi:putative transposase